ncbi:hypothetical protein SLS56_005584 [Neofusicoccum ribis]|uniref:Major facilitator superfamily (MFS) profile domain-containing protein n=1 Tax=Neofusicoccum ribis TaxID=45134 RepID=A0ABR3ST74_9PEZI
MEKDLNTSNTIGVMILSIYMLAFSVGPLITSPLSEIYGRLVVLQGSNAFFLIFNTACGFAKTPGQLLAFRFLSGIGGCATQSTDDRQIGGAVMGEMFTPLERGQAVSIYSVAPLLGPVVGPVCGGLLAQHASWRWCFWAVSLLDVLVQAGGAACLRETYAPVLLRRKRDALAAATGDERLRTEHGGDGGWTGLLGRSMEGPFRMLATQPIVQAMSLYAGYGYGLAFLLSATMPLVWEGRYGQPPSTASLNYLPSSIGVVVMSQVTPRLGNAVYGRLLARAPDGQGRPEFRVPLLFLAGVLTPVGLLWYGWSVEARMHAVMPNVGTVVFTAGTNMTFFCINQYLIDTYTLHAASALGAATVLRGVCGFCIPLFAPSMFQALGFGVGNTILAAVAVVIGFPGAFVVWKWGPEMRAKSLYARK